MDQMRVLLELGLLDGKPVDADGQTIQPFAPPIGLLWNSQRGSPLRDGRYI